MQLDQSILKTIIYFDCVDRAVTAVEVFRCLVRTKNVSEQESRTINIANIISRLTRSDALGVRAPNQNVGIWGFISEKNGYYMLKGREHLYEERIKRLKIADQQWKKMQRVAKWFALTPYVRLVMGSGSLGMHHMTEASDLDVLIVVKYGRIWTGRFLLTALIHALGARRYGNHIAGRVCLNHYITDRSLHIPFHSLYNAATYTHLVPIYEHPSIGPSFFTRFQEENSWIKNYLPDWELGGEDLRTVKGWRLFEMAAGATEWLLGGAAGNILERLLKRMQLNKIERRRETHAPGGRVRADDMMLEFHPNSPEKAIIDKFNKKILKFGLPERDKEDDSGLE